MLVNSRAIRNHILLVTVEKLKILYRLKKNLYLLIIILKDPIFYKNRAIHIKIEPLKLRIKEQRIIISFNILLLENNKAVLKIP